MSHNRCSKQTLERDRWCRGIFYDVIIKIEPIGWASTVEEASEGYSQERTLIWLYLARVGLTNSFNADALHSGLLALEKLKKTKDEYSQIMNRLGFKHNEEGSYENYTEWLYLPGLPTVRFPVKD